VYFIVEDDMTARQPIVAGHRYRLR